MASKREHPPWYSESNDIVAWIQMLYKCSYFTEPSDINLRISRIGCTFHQFPPTQDQSSYKLLSLTSTHLLGDHGWSRSVVLSSKTCFHVELWIYKKIHRQPEPSHISQWSKPNHSTRLGDETTHTWFLQFQQRKAIQGLQDFQNPKYYCSLSS